MGVQLVQRRSNACTIKHSMRLNPLYNNRSLFGKNLEALVEGGYEYILGARLKNEGRMVQQKLLKVALLDGQYLELRRNNRSRLIVQFSETRAAKDCQNRERGLRRLEKKLKLGKLTKAHINNR